MTENKLTALTATQAAAEIARGALSAAEYVGACLDRIAAVDGEIKAFVHLDRDYALAQARALDERRLRRPAARTAARHSGRHQRRHRHRRLSDRTRLAARQRAAAGTGRNRGREAARGRCGHHRQERDDGVCLLSSRADAQPARPVAHAGRLILGLGRRGRRQHGAACDRNANQRFGDPASLLLRRVRDQGEPRPHLARRHIAALAPSRSCRGLCPFAARSGARARCDCGLRPCRPRHAPLSSPGLSQGAVGGAAGSAVVRFHAHPDLGQGRRRHPRGI